jgi:UDP-GlcNAc3NAcA epimerase
VQKIVTIVGARPQFVKAGVVSRALQGSFHEVLVHTGQHYDLNMSDVFFRELELAAPAYNLGVGSGTHGVQTGRMLEAIEAVLLTERPDRLLIYGDTNSTLAGALAAAKLHIPIAHVEAGLRSFNREMPEEINRVVADHLSDRLFAPTETAVVNLKNEGITGGVHRVGDVMYDTFLIGSRLAPERSKILKELKLQPKEFLLLTLHRAENTDDFSRLKAILEALAGLDQTVVFPIHPRTRNKLQEAGIVLPDGALHLIDPVGYFDMVMLELNSAAVFTDSGGVQKEAYMAGVPCITLRGETEWVETVTAGWNKIVGADPALIRAAARLDWVATEHPLLYGDGNAAGKIAVVLKEE